MAQRTPQGGRTCLTLSAPHGDRTRLCVTALRPLHIPVSTSLQVPIYFSSAMASRALTYYTLLLNWTNANVRRSVFGAGAGVGVRRTTGLPSVGVAGAERDAGSPVLGGPEGEEEEEVEEVQEEDDLGAWGWGAWREGLSDAAGEGRGRGVLPGAGAVPPLPRGVVESSATRNGGGSASNGSSGRGDANGASGGAMGGVIGKAGATAAGAAGSGAAGHGAAPAAPAAASTAAPTAAAGAAAAAAAPASCGVFSEADVYGMFRTLPWDRSLLHVSTACRVYKCVWLPYTTSAP